MRSIARAPAWTPRSVDSPQAFRAQTGGALPIFEYVHSQQALRALQLQFGYGIVQGPRRAVARFRGRPPQGGASVLVWVTADAAAGERWSVRHCVTWAE